MLIFPKIPFIFNPQVFQTSFYIGIVKRVACSKRAMNSFVTNIGSRGPKVLGGQFRALSLPIWKGITLILPRDPLLSIPMVIIYWPKATISETCLYTNIHHFRKIPNSYRARAMVPILAKWFGVWMMLISILLEETIKLFFNGKA